MILGGLLILQTRKIKLQYQQTNLKMKIENFILLFIIALICLHWIFEIIHFVYLKKQKGKITINDEHWYAGIFYYNPDDRRVIVPKRIAWAGWALNFARPASFVIISVLIMVMILAALK